MSMLILSDILSLGITDIEMAEGQPRPFSFENFVLRIIVKTFIYTRLSTKKNKTLNKRIFR
jgi:hypothetical protein